MFIMYWCCGLFYQIQKTYKYRCKNINTHDTNVFALANRWRHEAPDVVEYGSTFQGEDWDR